MTALADGVELHGPATPRRDEILSGGAVEFVSSLQRRFSAAREALLELRAARQDELDEGVLPDFLAETREIREGAWTVPHAPDDLLDRRVEIPGPSTGRW